MDMFQGGNFIGYAYVDGVNVSVALVEQGLAGVHFTAERSVHYTALKRAEDKAKAAKLRVRNAAVPMGSHHGVCRHVLRQRLAVQVCAV